MSDLDLSQATASETATAVAAGRISALEATDAAIARIEALDGPLNAVVVRDFERARAAAKAIDAGPKSMQGRPLLGVPMTVKESNNVAGLPTTWGMPVFKDLPVTADGIAVARLKAAGAVILGKTNVPVALADWQAVNPIYGRTLNPFDHARTPGGSSGGSAAAVASGMVPLELGSDIGGSIRVPAHFCGVFGHKPSHDIIPQKGHDFPGHDGIGVELAVLGPLARSVDDLTSALDVMAGPLAGSGWRLDLAPARHARLADFRVLVLDSHPCAATDACVRGPLNALAEVLAKRGAKVVRRAEGMPDLAAAHRTYMAMLIAITTRGTPMARPIDAHAWMNLLDERMRIIHAWRAVFRDIDVVVMPPFGTPAYPHDDNPDQDARRLLIDGVETPYGDQLAWPAVATLPHLPATAVPLAKTKDGLPVGVQVMGAPFEDRTTLAFAALLVREGLAG